MSLSIEPAGVASSSVDTRHEALEKSPIETKLVQKAENDTKQCRQLMPLRTAARLYRKAIAWFLLTLTLAFLEGYSDSISGSQYAFPAFKWMYGDLTVNSQSASNQTAWFGNEQRLLTPAAEYTISPSWQAAISNAHHVGELFGLFATGILVDRFGFRKTLVTSLAIKCCLIFLQIYASKVEVFFAAELLMGIPWTVCQTIAITYPMEILPTELRGLAASFLLLVDDFGAILGYGVLKAMNQWFEWRRQPTPNEHGWGPEWAFRLPLSIQWAMALPVLVGGLFMPESPWWLVRKERREDAAKSVQQLRSTGVCHTPTEQAGATDDSNSTPVPSVSDTLHEICMTDAQQRATESGTRYLDAFRGAVSRRRTKIAVLVLLAPTFCGGALGRWSTVFLEGSTPLSAADSFLAGIVQQAVGVPMLLLSCYLMATVGRRRLLLCGLTGMVLVSVALGTLGFIDAAQRQSSPGSSGASDKLWPALYAACFVVLKIVGVACVGPTALSLVVEIPAARLRQKTVVISRLIKLLASAAESALLPYMLLGALQDDAVSLEPEQDAKDALAARALVPRGSNSSSGRQGGWGWGARAAFMYVGFGCAIIIWCWFRLPEPKGKSFRELDELFEKRTRARDFEKEINRRRT